MYVKVYMKIKLNFLYMSLTNETKHLYVTKNRELIKIHHFYLKHISIQRIFNELQTGIFFGTTQCEEL
jgi:hypothetical protein